MLKRLIRNLKFHISDSLAIFTESYPIFVIFEIYIAGMSIQTSITARISGLILTLLGLGWVYGFLRGFFRRIFNLTQSNLKIQSFFDLSYNCLFNIFISMIFGIIYFFAGADSWKQIFIGVLSSAIFGIVNGAPLGFCIDLFRNFFGLEENRINNLIQMERNYKFLIGVLIIFISSMIILELYLIKIYY